MHSIVPAPTIDRLETFAEFIDKLDPWETDFLRMTTLHVDPNAVCKALTAQSDFLPRVPWDGC